MKKLTFLLFILFSTTTFAQQEVERVPLEKMAKLEHLLGHWKTTNFAWEDNGWKQIATSNVHYFKKLKGKLIAEEISNVMPQDSFIVETFLSYDQYRNTYRLAAIDDIYGLMDIYEGDFIDDKTLQVTNLRAGTNFPTSDGGEMYFRLTFNEINNNTRNFLVERSSDNGQTWQPMNMNKMVRAN